MSRGQSLTGASCSSTSFQFESDCGNSQSNMDVIISLWALADEDVCMVFDELRTFNMLQERDV